MTDHEVKLLALGKALYESEKINQRIQKETYVTYIAEGLGQKRKDAHEALRRARYDLGIEE